MIDKGSEMNFHWIRLVLYKYCCIRNKYLDMAYHNYRKESGIKEQAELLRKLEAIIAISTE